MKTRPLLVQKYGGMSLATADHIRAAARRVATLRASGSNVLVVVSAMGAATDGLIQLAYSVSSHPNRRELDMLLSTGERVSMALFSMALTDALIELVPDARAISFTGSQAGLLTDETHSNARIVDVKSIRVQEELAKGNVVILAGFQGVSPKTKEITTLGRGGTDVTAVAMAAAFQATRCEILKEVPGVLSADPRVVPGAHVLKLLTHRQLLDMTFWGAKVLHYRSAELATTHRVPLYVGLAHEPSKGATAPSAALKGATMSNGSTLVSAESGTFENDRVLAVNSHATVRRVEFQSSTIAEASDRLLKLLAAKSLPLPQLLDISKNGSTKIAMLLTSPAEALDAQVAALTGATGVTFDSQLYSTVTVTCQGSYTTDLIARFNSGLEKGGIETERILPGPLGVTFVVKHERRGDAIKVLHGFVAT